MDGSRKTPLDPAENAANDWLVKPSLIFMLELERPRPFWGLHVNTGNSPA